MNQTTPAKMAREMLKVDRRARRSQNRTRIAHRVHASPRMIRPEMIAASCQPLAVSEAAAAQPQSVGPVARHTCRAPSAASLYCRLDLLIAAILWGLALACVALTLAIATGIALHLFGAE